MYTKSMFGLELKKRVKEKIDIIEIGIWVHTIYLEHCHELESGLRKIMLDLNTMELGSEFSISYKMLNTIANDLISGELVDLGLEKYRETDS